MHCERPLVWRGTLLSRTKGCPGAGRFKTEFFYPVDRKAAIIAVHRAPVFYVFFSQLLYGTVSLFFSFFDPRHSTAPYGFAWNMVLFRHRFPCSWFRDTIISFRKLVVLERASLSFFIISGWKSFHVGAVLHFVLESSKVDSCRGGRRISTRSFLRAKTRVGQRVPSRVEFLFFSFCRDGLESP